MLVAAISRASRTVHSNSIWYKTQGLGLKIEKLCRQLSQRDVLELLPSQQEALSKNLLDAASNVTIVQMPTSAGKTLLAELRILQTFALRDDAKIVYVVPTRALANQVLSDLRADFNGFDFVIEKTSASNDVDPTEDLFLHEEIDILISTPEKLDLLIRQQHTSVKDLALVVVDEAHNIRDGGRGARLELLLTMIKREKPQTRFMLLSPFMPDASAMKEWLSGGRDSIEPIRVDWSPSKKVFAGLGEKNSSYVFNVLPSAYSPSVQGNEEKEVSLAGEPHSYLSNPGTKKRLIEVAARHFDSDSKSVLYLCRGKKTADKTARDIAGYISARHVDEEVDLVARFAEDEYGEGNAFSESLRSGVAVHHAGLTDECKRLTEHLIRNGKVQHICATTTVAQGINFPISVLYVDDTRKGRKGHLSVSEFRNLAGRAGRTLVDDVGKVIFPFNSEANTKRAKSYLSQDASEVASAIAAFAAKSEAILSTITGGNGSARSDLLYKEEAMLPLLQYFVHLLSVAEEDQYHDQLDEILSDSFGYYSLQGEAQKRKFLQLCKVMYGELSDRPKGVLRYADKTGFSVPSVLSIMKSKSTDGNLRDPARWEPSVIFDAHSGALAEKISIIGKLREVGLGTDSKASPFNPKLVADILIGWVNGENVSSLSNRHPHYRSMEPDDKMIEFVTYLTQATFKSSWGMSVLEGIACSSGDELAENSYIPSMIYYGVATKEAVSMRMLGYPRSVSERLAGLIWEKDGPKTYGEVRRKVESLTMRDWEVIRPSQSALSSREWRAVSTVLAT